MGGHGHLSNQEALSAVLLIEPRDHVVLLHLSRDCNDPAVVAALHAGSDYTLTITSQERPSRWVRIGSTSPRRARADLATLPPHLSAPAVRPHTLWDHAAPRPGA
jgi:hypothetical protein